MRTFTSSCVPCVQRSRSPEKGNSCTRFVASATPSGVKTVDRARFHFLAPHYLVLLGTGRGTGPVRRHHVARFEGNSDVRTIPNAGETRRPAGGVTARDKVRNTRRTRPKISRIRER